MNQPVILQKGRENNSRLSRAIAALPLDRAYEVILRPYKAKRSSEQNRYWHGVVVKILSAASGLERDDVHAALCGHHFGWKDKRVPKSPRNPEGLVSVPLRTTTRDELGRPDTLNKQDMGDLIAFAQRFGAQHGVIIPDPDPAWFLKEDEKDDVEEQAA